MSVLLLGLTNLCTVEKGCGGGGGGGEAVLVFCS